jgi:hypothetical protein
VLDNRHLDSKGRPAKVGANATWHTDHTNQELPPKFTMLYAVAVPDKGGATSVCNSRAAYEALSDDLKRKIADAKTENTLISSARMATGNPDIVKAQLESTKPPTVHPLVRTHPDTGTKAVWFHKGKTETVTGMSPEETQDFLQDLTDQITQPQFCYAHEYEKGDLLIIDDRASLHKAGFDYDHSQHRRLSDACAWRPSLLSAACEQSGCSKFPARTDQRGHGQGGNVTTHENDRSHRLRHGRVAGAPHQQVAQIPTRRAAGVGRRHGFWRRTFDCRGAGAPDA